MDAISMLRANQARFIRYDNGNLWYSVINKENGLPIIQFPVPAKAVKSLSNNVHAMALLPFLKKYLHSLETTNAV